MTDGEDQVKRGPAPARGDEWAGWQVWRGDAFEDHAGPFYFREEPDRSLRCAFRAEAHHLNGGGTMHGGCILTFADYAMFIIGNKAMGGTGGGVTISLNGEFIGPVGLGDLVEAVGEVVRAGGSLIFMRGLISTGGRPVMTFSGVVKRLKR